MMRVVVVVVVVFNSERRRGCCLDWTGKVFRLLFVWDTIKSAPAREVTYIFVLKSTAPTKASLKTG